MNKFRPEMTPTEQREFLTHTRLFLSKDLKRAPWGRDTYVVKHVPTGNKMTLTSEQLFILGQFGRGSTVSELVPLLIMNRRCLPLREVYELILQARAANLLNEVRDEEFAVDYPPNWWPSVSGNVAQFLWSLACIGLLVMAVAWAWFIKEPSRVMEGFGWAELVLTIPVISLVASMGGLLASAYSHRLGVDVRRPRLIVKSLVPRIGFDWSDINMAGREACVVAAKLRILPVILTATLCTVVPALHPWAPIAVGAVLWRLAPMPGSAIVQWISTFCRRLPLSVERPIYFYHYAQTVSGRILAEFRATDWSFAVILSIWSLVWMAGVYAVAGLFVLDDMGALYRGIVGSGFKTIPALIALVVAVGVVAILVGLLISGWIHERSAASSYGRTARPAITGGLDPEQVIEDCPLLRELPVEVRAELRQMARVVSVRAGQPVVGIGEKGEDFYIVASGKLQLSLQRARGKVDEVAELVRGDVFGEFSFFGAVFRSTNMRANSDVVLLALSSPELEALLKRHLSIPVIEELVQRRAFLMRIALSSGWESGSVIRFAKAARFEDMKEGQVVIGTGRENRFFYLVYDGAMEVRHRGRRRARIAAGEFFGEISLLLNNTATADIVAEIPTRCLVLQKSDFLSLMGNDVELALQMEWVASSRLGRPLFPFQGTSVEALAN